MRKHTPNQVALWDAQNPDVMKILDVFATYLDEQRKRGIIQSAQDAQHRQLADEMTNAERSGDAEKAYDVANLLMSLSFEGRSPAEAAKWYEKAARKGHLDAEYRLAKLLIAGEDGVEQNLPLAVRLLTHAARQNHHEAMYELGGLYETGTGVKQDHTMAGKL